MKLCQSRSWAPAAWQCNQRASSNSSGCLPHKYRAFHFPLHQFEMAQNCCHLIEIWPMCSQCYSIHTLLSKSLAHRWSQATMGNIYTHPGLQAIPLLVHLIYSLCCMHSAFGEYRRMCIIIYLSNFRLVDNFPQKHFVLSSNHFLWTMHPNH